MPAQLLLLILVAFAAISIVDAQAVSLSLLDFRAGAASVAVTGRLSPTTYVPPFSVLTITISGTFPSGNFDSPADVVTISNGDSGRLLRYETWLIAQGSTVRNSDHSNYRSNFMNYAPYQTNSRTGSGWMNRLVWDVPNPNGIEDWYVLRFSAAICPTVSGTYGFKIPFVDDIFELYIALDDQVGFAVDATPVVSGKANNGFGPYFGSMSLTAGVRYAIIGLFFEISIGEGFQLQWQPPNSSSYSEIDPNVYCNARASMNGGVLKVYLSWPLFANEVITFTVKALPNPLNPQSSLSNVASGFNVRNIPLVYSQASVISTSAAGTYPSIQDPNLSPVTFRSSFCKGDSGLSLTVNLSPRILLPLGSRLLFKPFSPNFSTLPPPITWSSPSGVGSSVITGPVISGMIGYYSAASWATTQWNDLSGAGNHAIKVGGEGISVVPATNSTPAYLRGGTSDWVKFPSTILPSSDYTLFVVARYNGPFRGRIVQGLSVDWASGHMHGKSGVGWHSPTCGWVTEQVDCCGDQWTMTADAQSSSAASLVFRVNGVNRIQSASDCGGVRPRLAVNFGGPEVSNWAIQHVIVYNRVLTLAEIQHVEAFLSAPSSVTVMPTSVSSTPFAANSAVQFHLATFNNPSIVQAITSADFTVGGPTALTILASGTGTFNEIVDCSIGSNQPNITLSSTSMGDANVTMTVVITPAAVVPSNGRIIISLTGTGIALTAASQLAFTSPSNAAATFFMSSLVLNVTLTAGTFAAGSPIVFTVTKIRNPPLPQSALSNVAAILTTNDMSQIGRGTEGTFPAIVMKRKRWVFVCGSAANDWACSE